jgi:magnesium chelatase subunit D
MPRRAAELHLPATVVAAAPHQGLRGRTGSGLVVQRDDLRRAEREGREGNLVLFAVDASGSMAARKRMAAVSGAVLSLLRDAYQRRDKVGLLTFRGTGAEVVLPPTSSVPAAQARLSTLRTGGRTPLADGLLAGAAAAGRRAAARPPPSRPSRGADRRPGHGRHPPRQRPGPGRLPGRRAPGADGIATVVVDCEAGPVRLGLAARGRGRRGARLVALADLSADRVAGVVHAARAA